MRDEPGRMAVESALLHLGDAESMLKDVDRFTALDVPADVFANLTAVIADLKLFNSERLECYRCRRTVPTETLERTTEGLFKCSPDKPGYDACQRIYNTV
ncbi:hypothetical protein HOS59_gp28 [Streptomyces phage Rowa]|uniref:Uncharacterized protein n=1 Tax=Streptomyces phage Rowa TaxID=2059883 RepID=A0A2H5BLV8_9CAUD|nr:hypothetical protein HOS59_gp28 [Streptomyces phage Rowa]AUG87292.1 hypothetical protein SEA_ROWA_28 [Streptomyces phage Rowa]